jgi:outer membrane autotransporter protein
MGGLEIGVDNTSRSANGALILGALLGYSESTLKFEVDDDKAHYTLWHFGAYGSYISGPLFVDFLLKDDSTKVKFDIPGINLDDKSGNSIGAKVSVGERLEDSCLVFEPMATVSLVHSSLDTLQNPSASFAFADANSVRGLIGLQVSSNIGSSTMAVEPFVFAGIGQEFDGQNSVTMISAGTQVEIKDRPFRIFAAGSLGFNVLGNNGFSAYLRADGLVANHGNSVAVWAGLRFGL